MKKYNDLDYILLNSGEIVITLGNWSGNFFRGRMTYFPERDGKYKKVQFPTIVHSATGRLVLDRPGDEHYIYSSEDVKKIYSPLDSLNNLDKNEQKVAERILDAFKKHGVEKNKNGLIGSHIVNNQNSNSDFDWVVYGRENLSRVKEAIKQEFDEAPLEIKLPRFKKDIDKEYFERFGLNKRQILKMFSNMWTFIQHDNHKISLYFCDLDYFPKIKNILSRTIELEGRIDDNTDSYFQPRIYRFNSYSKIQGIVSWLFVYRNSAFEIGDRVIVKGRECEVDGKPFLFIGKQDEGIYPIL